MHEIPLRSTERETDTQARRVIKVAGTYRYHPRAQPRPHLLTVNGTTITLLFESLWPAEGPFITSRRVSLAPTRFLARVEILPPSGPQFLSTSTDKAENLYSRYITFTGEFATARIEPSNIYYTRICCFDIK